MSNTVTVPPGGGQSAGATPAAEGAPSSAPPAAAIPPDVLRASLRSSVKDAVAWSVMQGAGANYLTPFIILGGSGLLRVAAFSGLPLLAGAFVQLWAANVTDTIGRRNRMIVPSALIQAFGWLPICLAIFLPQNVGYWVMLAAYILHVGLANSSLPAWQSLMGDLVPVDRRGRYFGVRNALSGAVLMLSFWAAGGWLTQCDRPGGPALFGLSGRDFGFLVLFAVACVARFISAWYLSRVYEPEYRLHQSDRFTLLDFIRRAPKAHFGRFVFYCTIVHAGFGFMGPFIGWYLLDQLHFTPAAYATIAAASLAANFGTQPLWGRLLDRIGSKRVLAIGGIGVVPIPFLWLLCSGSSVWPYVGVMIYDGIASAAFFSAMSNYLFDVVTPPKRARCVAYNALFLAIGGTLGTFAGALVGEFAPLPLHWVSVTITHPFTLLLLGSAALRALANLLLLWSFEEFRLSRPVFEAE